MEDKHGKYKLAIGIWLLLQSLDEFLTYCSGYVMECMDDPGDEGKRCFLGNSQREKGAPSGLTVKERNLGNIHPNESSS